MNRFFKKSDGHAEPNLKGTFVLVLILGSLIVISWVTVFFIFMTR